MSTSASNPRQSSYPSPTRRGSTSPRALPSSPTSSTSSPPPEPAEHFPTSPSAIQISRTVSVTVEVLSGSTPASRLNVLQHHLPVTASCYSQTSSRFDEYSDATLEYGSSTSQGSYSFIPFAGSDASSSYYGKTSENGTQSSAGYSYNSLEDCSASTSQRQQYSIGSTHMSSSARLSRLTMLDRFLTVDSREDALVVETRAAIREGTVKDDNIFAPGIYGWEAVIDSL